MDNKNSPQLRQVNYEIFVIFLTFLSWVNVLLLFFVSDSDSRYVIVLSEQVLTIFFLFDFLYRLGKANPKRRYFVKYGWLDLVGSFPFLRWLRGYRVFMTMRYLRKERGRFLFAEFLRNRAETAVLTVTLAVILLFEFASIFILQAENGVRGANILTAGDAIWWVLVTVATIGYGDLYPVTKDGRFIASFVIVAGVGLFGILSGFLARNFLGEQTLRSTTNDAPTTEIPLAANQEITQQILAELQEIRVNQTNAQLDQKSANAQVQERLALVEQLLASKRLKE